MWMWMKVSVSLSVFLEKFVIVCVVLRVLVDADENEL